MIWVIVLAGGSGVRLAHEARRQYGYARPKQFCDFDGRGTLLAQTLERARRLTSDPHILVVTVRAHRHEANEALAAFAEVRRLELPANRDTTSGIAVPLRFILDRDPEAEVVVMPSDHAISNRALFTGTVFEALAVVRREPDRMALLGAPPSGYDDGVGWLVPESNATPGRWPGVACFREKPDPREAAQLAASGARVNTFVFTARATVLAAAIAQHCPETWRAMASPVGLDAAFAALPTSSFSRDVLEQSAQHMTLVTLPAAAGWSDIGTPERLARALRVAAA